MECVCAPETHYNYLHLNIFIMIVERKCLYYYKILIYNFSEKSKISIKMTLEMSFFGVSKQLAFIKNI